VLVLLVLVLVLVLLLLVQSSGPDEPGFSTHRPAAEIILAKL
jgi:preprotein translocase subunit SecG